MLKPKTYNSIDVYNNTLIGFEIDFFTSKSDVFLCEDLSKFLCDDIKICNKYTNRSCLHKEYNSNISKYKLYIHEGSYGIRLPQVKNIINYLNEFGYADNTSILKTNISFNNRTLNTLFEIKNINADNFINTINEDFFYDKFIDLYNNPRVMKFDVLHRLKGVIYASDIHKNHLYVLENCKLLGVDFSESYYNKLGFNYIGGKDIFKDVNLCEEIINKYILHTHDFLNSYDKNYDKHRLNVLNVQNNIMSETYNSPSKFTEKYKDIKIFVNLSNNEQIIKSSWNLIREQLFNLYNSCPTYKGHFNYDSDTNRCQLKDGVIHSCDLKNYDIIDCEINKSILSECVLVYNKANACYISDSFLGNNNNIYNSVMNNTNVTESNIIKKGKLYAEKNVIFDGNAYDTLFDNINVSSIANTDEKCIFVKK